MATPVFHQNPNYYNNLSSELKAFQQDVLKQLIFQKVIELSATFFKSEEPVPFKDIGLFSFKKIKEGESWANHVFECAWFHLSGKIPSSIDKSLLYLDFDCSGEALLVDSNGSAVKGFTNGSSVFDRGLGNPEKRYYPIKGLENHGDIDIYIDAGSNDLFGSFQDSGTFKKADIVKINKEAFDLYFDFETLLDYLSTLSYGGKDYVRIIRKLEKVRSLTSYHSENSIAKSRELLEHELAFFQKENKMIIVPLGHAHLDLAWLWPIRETRRKVLRTFSNVVYLSGIYEDFRFAVSQPQQLAWLKQDDSTLYSKVKSLIANGKIELVGGSYVENDTNLVGEESLARQSLYGQKFYKEEFGQYAKVMWLPDTFGYSGALPQVYRLSGLNYFVTTKMSWCLHNKFPFHNFVWEGIDGSQILAHIPPDETYNSGAFPSSLKKAEDNLGPLDGPQVGLMLYGIGDGGAGPSVSHLERLSREKKLKGLPIIHFGTASSFFTAIKSSDKKCSIYHGEMYLENHQGTYTSQSQNKFNNRLFEERMRSLEAFEAIKGIFHKNEIDALWKEALLYEFHDILPGSSIKRVYDETDSAYKRMETEIESLANTDGITFIPSAPKFFRLINHLPFVVRKIIKLDNQYYEYQAGPGELSSFPKEWSLSSTDNREKIETPYYSIDFSLADGHIKSVYSKLSKKIVLVDANRLRVFIDCGDAWNIKEDYRDQKEVYMTLVSRCVNDYGKIHEVYNLYSFKKSTVKETIVINDDSPVIGISHDVDWKDTGFMLRSANKPTDYSPSIRSDIQFGYLDRSTGDETPKDKAQFEICSYKWADISDGNNGIAILNNTKNGIYAKHGVMELSLLRSTNYPCEESDQKPIHYSYALYPHKGDSVTGSVDELAEAFNASFAFTDSIEEVNFPTTNQGVSVSTLKNAYDGRGLILRVYENRGKKVGLRLSLPKGMTIIQETNLLEDKIGEASKGYVTLSPFEIKTFRIERK